MKQLSIFILIFGLFSVTVNAKEIQGTSKFGGKITESSALKLSQVVEDFKNYKDKTVVIEAQAQKVCEQKGCWMVLTDGSHEIRTVFKDYGFFVPKDILNKKIKVQGVMEQISVSVAKQKHYLKDAGASARDIKKIVSSKMEYQFTADAVEIL